MIEQIITRPEQRILEHADWLNEAEEKFGNNPFAWRWVCPECGTVQTAVDLIGFDVPETLALNTAMCLCVGQFCDERVGCGYHASVFDAPVLLQPGRDSQLHSRTQPTPAMEFARPDQLRNLVRRRLFGLVMDDIACSQIGGCSADGYTISLMSTSMDVVLHPEAPESIDSVINITLPKHWRLCGLRRLGLTTGEPEIIGLVNFKEGFAK